MNSKSRKPADKAEEQKSSTIVNNGSSCNVANAHSPADAVFSIQQKVGNHAVQRLLESRRIKAKLEIGRQDDEYEREADRVAEKVMRMQEPQVSTEEEPVTLHTKLYDKKTQEVDSELESSISQVRGNGQPLPDRAREYFESSFGYDFGKVRVHSNSKAANIAGLVNARAFTLGRDIVFGAGQFLPDTTDGKSLLAHELTHVIQQNSLANVPRGINQQKIQVMSNEALTNLTLQKQGPGPATITQAPTGTVIKVFIFRIPNDEYMRTLEQYIRNTLAVPDQDIQPVDSFEEIFQHLDNLHSAQAHVNRIIIAAHGRTVRTGSFEEGQIRSRGGWITEHQVRQVAQGELARRVRGSVIAQNAIVEFWGCTIGQHFTTLSGLSQATGAEVWAPTVQTAPQELGRFFVTRTRQEGAESRAESVHLRHSSDLRPSEQTRFRDYLLQIYDALAANFEVTTPTADDEQRLIYMRDLFDRSGGIIRSMALGTESDVLVRPGEGQAWVDLWRSYRYRPNPLAETEE